MSVIIAGEKLLHKWSTSFSLFAMACHLSLSLPSFKSLLLPCKCPETELLGTEGGEECLLKGSSQWVQKKSITVSNRLDWWDKRGHWLPPRDPHSPSVPHDCWGWGGGVGAAVWPCSQHIQYIGNEGRTFKNTVLSCSQEATDGLEAPGPIYLFCRNPWLPSGPAGCRTVWLFDRVSSEGSVELWCPGLSVLGLSWGISSGQALPNILFLASAYSASRWARDLTCGVGLFWFKGDPSDPLLVGRFKMRIWGGGAAGRESSCIIMVFNRDREEL